MIVKGKEIEAHVKRARYADGYGTKKFKLGGVKRLFYIGLLPFSQESRHNVRIMLQAIKLSKLHFPFTFSPDIKMDLYLIMKQDAGCKHNCIYCTSCAPWLEEAELLTFGMLWRLIPGTTVPPKVHLVEDHIITFLERFV